MTDKILEDVSLDFDIKNHAELTPYVYFTQNALDMATSDSYDFNDVKNNSHETWTSDIINRIEGEIFTQKYFGKEKEKTQKYQKSIISQIKRCLLVDIPSESIEKQFCHSYDIVKSQNRDLSSLLNNLKKKIKNDFKQMAVPTKDFPHFTGEISENNSESNADGEANQDIKEQIEKIKEDNEKMNEILSKISTDDKKNQNKCDLSLDDLTQLYNILENNKKSFSFSPSFVLSCIQKLDSYLNLLISTESKSDQNSTEKIESNDQKQFNFFLNLNSNSDENQRLLRYYFTCK